MQIKAQHPNSLFLQAIIWQMHAQAFEVPALMTFYLHNKSLNKLLFAQTTVKHDVWLCDLCSSTPAILRFTHLLVHSAFTYSSSIWFSWSFRVASIGLAHSWNTSAPNWWALKSVTLYKHLDKTFPLQPSETAAEKPANNFSCKE